MPRNLPPVVNELLLNNSLLQLGTSKDDVPSVSLMSFSFIPATDSTPPTIILSSEPNTQKIINIKANPNVSLLIHDWTSHQNPNRSSISTGKSLSVPKSSTNISQFLEKLNQAQLSQTSVTLYGHARIPAGEEADYFRAKHLQINPDAACFIKNANIVLVVPHQAKVADSENHVQSFDL